MIDHRLAQEPVHHLSGGLPPHLGALQPEAGTSDAHSLHSLQWVGWPLMATAVNPKLGVHVYHNTAAEGKAAELPL
jgi:hypothetical protein